MKLEILENANEPMRLSVTPIFNNVYAISRDYVEQGNLALDPEKFKHLGLYDGHTFKAIPGGEYFFYMREMPDETNYNLTGREFLPANHSRAKPSNFSEFGSKTPIFGGYVDSHMGHFFLEVLARGINFSLYKDHPIVFLIFRKRANLSIFYEYCKFFGLDKSQIVIVSSPVIIPKLYVPRPQFYITDLLIKKIGNNKYAYNDSLVPKKHVPAEYFSDEFLEVHRLKGDQISIEENTVDKVLYLSCVKYKDYFGEIIIHKTLEEHGHTVIYPEEHSWEYVINLVRTHTHIVGFRGSAMHFLMFCRAKKIVTYFGVQTNLYHNFFNLEQMMCNDYQYVQVRAVNMIGAQQFKNMFLFQYNDIIELLDKIGIHDIPKNSLDYYEKVIVPAHKKYLIDNRRF